MLLSVGRLAPQKDFPSLLGAFSLIADSFPTWDLAIVGEGEERSSLMQQVESLDLKDRVFLPGTYTDIGRLYDDADLFVLPSAFESFGIAAGEAMAHGLATVAFDNCPGLNDIIQHEEDGVLVNHDDRVKNLAEVLKNLMSSPERRRDLGDAAKRNMRRYSIDQVGPQFLEFVTAYAKGS
jgi:glycosyltransferase involved in cell wall biosynthesis